jgi:hypothetical protein
VQKRYDGRAYTDTGGKHADRADQSYGHSISGV